MDDDLTLAAHEPDLAAGGVAHVGDDGSGRTGASRGGGAAGSGGVTRRVRVDGKAAGGGSRTDDGCGAGPGEERAAAGTAVVACAGSAGTGGTGSGCAG